MSVQVELKPVATTDTKVSALSRRIAVSADKWGIEGFMEAVEQEVARFNIGVTIVEQGGARTDFRHGGAQLGAVQFHSKTPGGQSFWRPNTISKSWLWNRKTISPGCLQQGALRLNQPTIASLTCRETARRPSCRVLRESSAGPHGRRNAGPTEVGRDLRRPRE